LKAAGQNYIRENVPQLYMPGSPLCMSTESQALTKQLIMQRQLQILITVKLIQISISCKSVTQSIATTKFNNATI